MRELTTEELNTVVGGFPIITDFIVEPEQTEDSAFPIITDF